MRRIALLSLLTATLTVAAFARAQQGAAKDGSSVTVTPDAGELGTTVQLGSDYWTPNAEVKIYAGFSPPLYVYQGLVPTSLVEPAQLWGPIAVTRSDAANTRYGSWRVRIRIDSTAQMPIPRQRPAARARACSRLRSS